ISGITYSGTTATVTARVPHGRAANEWVRIAGAFVNGAAVNPFNGSFRISNVTLTGFQYTMPSTLAGLPDGDMWLDRFPSHIVKISGITPITDPDNPNLYDVTTYSPHYRIPGDLVSIRSILVSSVESTVFNGVFKVFEKDPSNPTTTSTKFRYKLRGAPDGTPDVSIGVVGVEFHAIGVG